MILGTYGRAVIAVLTLAALLCQGTLVLAGTTGGLAGTVVDSKTKQPLSAVKVTAASPSQIATSQTDSSGHFQFLNLAPDTYTISAQISGYEDVALSGVTVVSDNTRILTLSADKQLKTIGSVTATRTNGSLVRSGTTADVYSINAVQQAKVSAAGGGGTLDSAFSALSTVPGVAVMPGQAGYIGAAATLSIRGGDYDQIGYQFDGIPINRSFDNYPSSATSSLGQQELQVYTGAPPPSTESEGISGYINQVIKTGTNPGFTTGTVGIGSPYYHKIAFETGGVVLNNRLSYYVGLGGYNQSQRYVDQYDGASLSNSYGYPYGAPCDPSYTQAQVPSCYVNGKFTPEGNILMPITSFSQSQVADRDSIINLHYYFPHKDGTRDDFQALYDNSALSTQVYSSANDLGGVALQSLINQTFNGVPALSSSGRPNSINYTDGYQFNSATGGFLPANYQSLASIYYFPNVAQHQFGDQISPDLRDGFNNDQSIVKLQFTKSLGQKAFFRAYGYTYYSDWLNSGPNSAYIPYGAINGDYELESHSRGAGFQFSDQLNTQNLLSVDGDYQTSHVVRDNNSEYVNGDYGPDSVNSRTAIGVLVDSSNPTNGICYGPGATAGAAAVAVNCLKSPTSYNAAAQYATLQQAYTGTIAPVTESSCGAGACKYLIIGNGQYATYNEVQPQFFGASINDEFRPTSKLTINAGMRLDDYQFIGGDTSGGNARAFWYNAYNSEVCENADQTLVTKAAPGAACPTGSVAVNFSNPSGKVTQTYPEFQPRFGFTYAFTPTTVFRAAYGRYTQPPNTAFEQYDALQSNAPALLYGTYGFQQYGFTTPNHPVPPAASNNFDFSIEQALPGQVSFKISPFLRKTQNQVQQFFLNRATNFVSGLNVGNQTSQGVEFELDKGDFSRDGLSAKLSFAYTNSYIRYNTLSNGTTVLSPVVDGIKAYNALTKAGGGSPCYTLVNPTTGAGGTPDPACGAGSIANPYYNAPSQNIAYFNGSQNYVPYDTIPAGIGVSSGQYGSPYVASLVLNEKIKRFAITPIVQLFAGSRYGAPLSTNGIDPTTCSGIVAASAAGDPRYKYGSVGGAAYDATTCGQLAGGIPNVQSGAFDGLGAYVQPSQALLHLQMSYDVTKNVNITANFTNLVNTCFGGSKVPWAVQGACGYGLDEAGLTGGIGNTYNPGDAIQPALRYSYEPFWSQQPVGIYVNASVKL